MAKLFNTDFIDVVKSTDWKWSFSDYPEQKNGIKVFSCFAGGGGSTMGYKLAGCDVLGCVEIDKKMNAIYVKNHNPKYNYLMDIREFNALDNLPIELYNLDILDGSPPCTTFSVSGDREASWGIKKVFREGQVEQTLDDLSFVFIDTVAKLRPKIVIMENVEGLFRGAAFKYVKQINSKFDDVGYFVRHWLLKGEFMGVPQARHRSIFVAVRKDISFNLKDLNMDFNYAPITYGDIKFGEGKKVNPKTMAFNLLLNAKEGDSCLADVRRRIDGKWTGFNDLIFWESKIPFTITASVSIFDKKDMRHISKESVVRIQTFPSDFDFINDSLSNVVYVCGMSVPPIMIRRIVERLLSSGLLKSLKGCIDEL